jgi:hypothetical protein
MFGREHEHQLAVRAGGWTQNDVASMHQHTGVVASALVRACSPLREDRQYAL